MGTTVSTRDPPPDAVQGDVNAIFQGMTDDVIARQQARRGQLPPQLASSYQPPIPTALQPPPPATPPAPGPQQSPAPWATQPGRLPGQVAINTPQIQLTPQVVQQPPQLPPRTGERPPLQNMPQLWNGGTVGPSGQTKQQFLVGRMMHESQGDPQALNYVARGDPRAYDAGYTAQGLLQDVNSTWEQGAKWAAEHPDQYPMSVDPRQFKTAREAPWDVQWQVNSAIYDHRGETPWKEQGGGFRGYATGIRDEYSPDQRTPHQNYLPAEPRSFHQWGQDPPGQPARPQDSGGIFGKFAPLLLGIASLALRLPLSSAITAYSAMARAQYNGQQDEYERQRTKNQDAWKEASAKQNLESSEYGDAFATYGENNPQGLQQTLAQIALKYNDPQMLRLVEQGDLNGAHRLQAQRDMLNQNLVKGSKALEEEQDRKDERAAVAALDRKWHDDFVKEHGREPTADETAIQHNIDMGIAGRAGTKDPKGDTPEKEGVLYNVVGADGKTIRQVRSGQTGGLFDLTGKPTSINEAAGEHLVPASAKQPPPPDTNPFMKPGSPGSEVKPEQQPDQPAPGDQGGGDQGSGDQGDTGDQGALPQPYQVAQAGAGVPPPPTKPVSTPTPASDAPAMGPRMSALNEDGQRMARDYATNGNEALQDVPAKYRMPLIQAGQELRDQMQQAAQSGLTGEALNKRLHQIDPTYADYLNGVSTYANDLPTPGRTGSAAGRIMALSIAGKLNPNFKEQNLKAQENFRLPGGPTQRTLSRAAIMAESGRQVREYLKALPADPGLERWQRAWDQFVNNKLVGDHRYSDLFVALRQYIQEANVLVRGGQESVTETGEQLGTRGEGGLLGGAAFAMPGNATPGMILGLLKTDARNTIARMDNFRNQWRQQDGHGEMPGDDAEAYKTFQEFSTMDVDKEAGVATDSDIDKFLKP